MKSFGVGEMASSSLVRLASEVMGKCGDGLGFEHVGNIEVDPVFTCAVDDIWTIASEWPPRSKKLS